MVDANRLGPHAGSSDARPTPVVAGTTPSHWRDRPARWRPGQPTAPKELSWTLPRASRGRNPRGGNDTPKAREIGYSAASPRSCVWWRYCGRHRGRSDRRDRRWSARGDRRRHRRCCPWRYCRREDCRGCAAWRPEPGEAIHQRRRIAGAPKPARLTPNALSRPPAERLALHCGYALVPDLPGGCPSSSIDTGPGSAPGVFVASARQEGRG